MSGDYNSRAARGQAYNLAVYDAISVNKEVDVGYIMERFAFYFDIGSLIQALSDEDIKKLKTEIKVK